MEHYDYNLHKNAYINTLTLLHSERPKLYTILAFLSATGLCAKLKMTNLQTLCS